MEAAPVKLTLQCEAIDLDSSRKLWVAVVALSSRDFKAWELQGKEVKLRPCVEVSRTVRHRTFIEVQRKWLALDVCFGAGAVDEAAAVAEAEAARRDDTTGKYKVVAIVNGVTVETPVCVLSDVGWHHSMCKLLGLE